VRAAISVLEHDRLKLGLIEVDAEAEAIRRFLVEARVAARPLPCNINRLARLQLPAAGAAFGLHSSAPAW